MSLSCLVFMTCRTPVWSVMTVQYHFLRRPYLYDRSRRCLIWFSSQIEPDPIDHDILVLFFTQITLVQSITSLTSLVFIINYIWSYRSPQFNFSFIVNHTNIVDHVIILSGFCHRPHLVWSITTTLFCFWCGSHLYNWSCRYPVQFSS